MLGALLDLVVPRSCLSCRGPLPEQAQHVCGPCRRRLRFLDTAAACPRCALPRPCARAGRSCPAADAGWEQGWAAVAYTGSAPALVAALKFRGALPCAALMAGQMVAGAPPGRFGSGVVLVPVPTAPSRRRTRGYDQADVLVRAVSTRTGCPRHPCLRRSGSAARQLGAGREQRLAAGRLAVRCVGPAPQQVVLVDDVHTTGATLRACTAALREAGTRRVAVVSWARTL